MKGWRGRVGEVVLIALGVILGLSAEAWLSELGERGQETEHLSDLRTEVDANFAELDRVQGWIDRRQALGRLFIESSATARTLPDSIDGEKLTEFFSMNDPRLQTATTAQLISAGELSIIRDVGVRTAVAGWSLATESVGMLVDFQRAHWSEVTQPMYIGTGEFAAIAETWMGLEIDGVELDRDAVTATKAFRDAVGVRMIDEDDVQYVLDSLLTPALVQLDSALISVGHQ